MWNALFEHTTLQINCSSDSRRFLRFNINRLTMTFICQIGSTDNELAGWNNSVRQYSKHRLIRDGESSARRICGNKTNERARVWVPIIKWMSDSRCLPSKLNPDGLRDEAIRLPTCRAISFWIDKWNVPVGRTRNTYSGKLPIRV